MGRQFLIVCTLDGFYSAYLKASRDGRFHTTRREEGALKVSYYAALSIIDTLRRNGVTAALSLRGV